MCNIAGIMKHFVRLLKKVANFKNELILKTNKHQKQFKMFKINLKR